MNIRLENIGKRFNREWIFKSITADFEANSSCAILGGNGSGKSTLLQIFSGFLTPSEGRISWVENEKSIAVDQVYKHVALATPYSALYEDFTLEENVKFFLNFKELSCGNNPEAFAELVGLEKHRHKALKFYSSGMRQRVKLGLAILAKSDILLLDEPVSHFDAKAIDWYQQLLSANANNRSVFIASNSNAAEIFSCKRSFAVEDFK
jgi:ABC-type multidrug transport system ATPase subunit